MKIERLTFALLLRQLRNPAYSVWISVFPLLLFLLFRFLWPGLGGPGALPAGLALYLAVTAGLLNQPLLYAQMRDEGMTRRLSLAPLHAFHLPAASAASTLLFTFSGQLLLLLAGCIFGDVTPAGILPFTAAAFLVSIAFMAAGLCLPGVFRNFLTLKNASNLVLAWLFVFSGIFFLLPEPFRALHLADPLFWMYGGLVSASQGGFPGPALLLASAGVGLSAVLFIPVFRKAVGNG